MFTLDKTDKWNKDQVEPFLAEFTKIHELMMRESGRNFSYNDDFLGRIPGIAGPDEGTAIYLLQGLYRIREEQRQMKEYRADGYWQVHKLEDKRKFRNIVVYHPGYYSGGTGQLTHFEDARLCPDEFNHAPSFVLPKGKRNRGHRVRESAVVLVKD